MASEHRRKWVISRWSWICAFAGSGNAASSLVIEMWKVTVTKLGWSTNQQLTTTNTPVAGVDMCEAHAPAEFLRQQSAWQCMVTRLGIFSVLDSLLSLPLRFCPSCGGSLTNQPQLSLFFLDQTWLDRSFCFIFSFCSSDVWVMCSSGSSLGLTTYLTR